MSLIRSSIAALVLVAGSSFAIAQTAAPAAPVTTPAAPAIVAPTAAVPAAQPEAHHNNPVWVKFRAACKADIAKHCGDVEKVKGERGKMRACLDTHKADLSADCKSAIVERDAAAQAKKS
jgi:Cysteine rich repeat